MYVCMHVWLHRHNSTVIVIDNLDQLNPKENLDNCVLTVETQVLVQAAVTMLANLLCDAGSPAYS